MKKLIAVLLLGFVLLSHPGFSEAFQYTVNADISDNKTVLYNLNLVYVNNPKQEISLTLKNPLDIRIESQADCTTVKKILETEISCSMDASEKTEIKVTYISDENVKNRDDYFLYTDSFKLNDDIKTLSVIVKLPEATGLSQPIENSYSPSDALIGSDGRRLLVNWIKSDIKEGDTFDVSIAFEKTGETSVSSFPLEYIVVIIIVSFSAFALFYQIYLRDKGIKLILPVLKSDEKTIYNSIIKHGNGVNQKVIVKESGYSKAKVSKVLNSLKERGLIKLERIGRSNKVYIEKNFEKKA